MGDRIGGRLWDKVWKHLGTRLWKRAAAGVDIQVWNESNRRLDNDAHDRIWNMIADRPQMITVKDGYEER